MALYTSTIRNKLGTDITVKRSEGIYKVLAPTWKMVLDHKAGKITDAEYTSAYRRLLRERFYQDQEPFLEITRQAYQGDLILCCFCPPDKFCHRYLAVEIIQAVGKKHGMGIPYKGEVK